MVTSAGDTIKLELTVDVNSLRRQLDQIFPGGMPGGAPTTAGGGGAGTRARARAAARATAGRLRGPPAKVDPGRQMGKALSPLVRLAGIYFGINAMLKSSVVAQTTMGALSATLGAISDAFLIHLVPLMNKLLVWLAEHGIPAAAEAGKRVVKGGGIVLDTINEYRRQWDMLGGGNAPKEVEERHKRVVAEDLLSRGRENVLMGVNTPTASLEKIAQFSEAQYDAFLHLQQRSQPNFNVTINSVNLDEIMVKVREELNDAMRNQQSRSPAGG